MNSRRLIPITSVLVGIILLSACQNQPIGKAEQAESPGLNIENEATMYANALLPDPAKGLDGLKSYHMSLVQTFEGTVKGVAVQTRVEQSGDMVSDHQMTFVTLQQQESDGRITSSITGAIGPASYRQTGDDKALCHVNWNPDESGAPSLWPVDFLPAILSAEDAGSEQVNSVNTHHYRLSDVSLGVLYFEKVSGDIWLDEAAGYLVKGKISMTGSENAFGAGNKGTRTLSYELSNINANDDFIVPGNCKPVLTGVPIMADAVKDYRLPGTLRYYSTSSMEKILEFYTQELTKAEWIGGGTHTVGSQGKTKIFIHPANSNTLVLGLQTEKDWVKVVVTEIIPSAESQEPEPTNQGEPTIIPEEKYSDIVLNPADYGVPGDVPIYPGANKYSGYEGMRFEFSAPDPVEKVKEFYKTNLKKAGWAAMPGGGSTPTSPLMFRKNKITLIIQISSEDGGSRVALNSMES
jgi:hypothetical protein